VCGLCGVLAGSARSAGAPNEALFEGNADRIARDRARRDRLRLANDILGYYRLRLDDAGGQGLILRSATGRAQIVRGFVDVWPAAERLCGRACDPLDPQLLAYLEKRRRSPR